VDADRVPRIFEGLRTQGLQLVADAPRV
jgi:hypothetical protein